MWGGPFFQERPDAPLCQPDRARRDACRLHRNSRPCRHDVQPHRHLPGRDKSAGRRRQEDADLVRDHRGERRRQHAGLFRQPAGRGRLHRHHRPEGAEGRWVRSRPTASRPRSTSPAARCWPASTPRRARPSRPAICSPSTSPRKAIEATCDLGGQPDSVALVEGRQIPRHRDRERARRRGERRRNPAAAGRQSEDRPAATPACRTAPASRPSN